MDSKKMSEPVTEESRSNSPALRRYSISDDGHFYYVIMERLVTKLNDIEHELKCAWRILDILNQECIKMWERLEKLEDFLYEQQNVITQLVEYRVSENSRGGINTVDSEPLISQKSSIGELDAIAESLGAAIGIEETSVLREKLAQQELTRMHSFDQESTTTASPVINTQTDTRYIERLALEEIAIPDEAFYRSLNNAYREDLICGDLSRPTSQLGMIWEEAEDIDDSNGKKDLENIFEVTEIAERKDSEIKLVEEPLTKNSQLENEIYESNKSDKGEADKDEGEVFSAADYKTYRGDSPCISERDLAQLSRLSSIDEVSLENFHELNRLTTKLQKDSQNLMELRARLIESPKRHYASEAEAKLSEEASSLDEQLRKIYTETDVDNWQYSKSPGSTGRSASRVSTDSGLTTDGDFTTRSISPRLNTASKSNLDSISSTYTVTKVNYARTLIEKSPESIIQLPIDVGNFAKGYAENKELTDLMVESLVPATCVSPAVFNTMEKISPTHSISSIHSSHSTRTQHNPYFSSAAIINLEFSENKRSESLSPASPPPPAPCDANNFLLGNNEHQDNDLQYSQGSSFLSKNEKCHDQVRLSPRTPHSPKSPRISPKHIIKPNNNIVTVKSDSGLSSMSGWSSLDKSPSSPKTSVAKILTSSSLDYTKVPVSSNTQQARNVSSIFPLPETSSHVIQEPFYDTPEGKDIIPNKISVAASYSCVANINHFSSPKDSVEPNSMQPDFDFVPPPAPEIMSFLSPERRDCHEIISQSFDLEKSNTAAELFYGSSTSAIYSLAGSNRPQSIACVNTSDSEACGLSINTSFYSDTNNSLPLSADDYNKLQQTPTIICSPTPTKKCVKTCEEETLTSDSFKTAVFRTRFPTGSITDALSYYPTSASLPRIESNDPNWLNTIEANILHDSTSSSIRSSTSDSSYSQNTYADKLYPHPPSYQSSTYHIYANQGFVQPCQQQYQIYNQSLTTVDSSQLSDTYQRQWQREYQPTHKPDPLSSCIELEQQREYYDTSSVIVSQSGYISISTDIKDYEVESSKASKKIRRGSSLKNAMNSVSNWLPDLNLSKRHRSQSLPGGVRREDLDIPEDATIQLRLSSDLILGKGRGRGQLTRKKKKNTLVSTVSGILQKAKRKSHQSQSHSDPEQSETEWSSERQSGLSEDEESVFSEIIQDPSLFAKVRSSTKRKTSQQLSFSQNVLEHECSFQQKTIQQQQQVLQQQQQVLQQQIQQHQEQLQQKVAQEKWIFEMEEQETSDLKESEFIEPKVVFEEETLQKSVEPSNKASTIFATVGDIKKCNSILEETLNDKTTKLQSVPLMGGASMEFAVSRALGKYRLRQSSTIADDQIDDISSDRKSDELAVQLLDTNYQENILEKSDKREKGSKLPELVTSIPDEAVPAESSPSGSSLRGYHSSGNRFAPRHQQSLEIPWAGSRGGDGDEDNRSTHSYRSTSRVSSRRQSTEDSIDSEDEWYCYELRKLEELERQTETTIESDLSHILVLESEEVQFYQPDNDIKEKMSFVLKELKVKTISRNDNNINKTTNDNLTFKLNGAGYFTKDEYHDERPAPKRKSAESIETVFARVTDYHTWSHEEDMRREKKVTSIDDGSSGETSGPDSPVQSINDEEEELQKELEEMYSRRSSSGSTLRQSEKLQPGSDSLSREGSVSVPPSEVSVSIPGAWDSESTIPEGERDDAGSTETGTTATLSLPKIKVDTSSCASSDTTIKEGQVSPGPPGSKWKLLKALKERKAEEKLKEVEEATKEAATIAQGHTAVSIII